MQLLTQQKVRMIDDAPKDGRHILAWDSGTNIWIAVRWSGWGGGIWQCSNTGHNISSSDSLTHWIEQLPNPDAF